MDQSGWSKVYEGAQPFWYIPLVNINISPTSTVPKILFPGGVVTLRGSIASTPSNGKQTV